MSIYGILALVLLPMGFFFMLIGAICCGRLAAYWRTNGLDVELAIAIGASVALWAHGFVSWVGGLCLFWVNLMLMILSE